MASAPMPSPNSVRAFHEIGLSFANPDSGTTVPAPDGFGDLWSEEAEVQGKAFREILTLTAEPVGWAYAVWDELLKRLTDRNNRRRSIAAQVLCNLAKSDPSKLPVAGLSCVVCGHEG